MDEKKLYSIKEMSEAMFCCVSKLQKKVQREGLVPAGKKNTAYLYTYYQYLYLKGEL
jgi:hypothetical protein